MAEKSSSFNENQIIEPVEKFFKQAPHLSASIRDTLVKIVPWIALVFGVLSVLGGLGLVTGPKDPVLGMAYNSTYFMLNGIFTIVVGIMMLIAFPKLRKNQYGGWRLLFWVVVINVASSLLGLMTGNLVGAVIGAIVSALIGFYFLFEIKSHYK